ncbi:sulfatase [Microbacterium hominis]|uniref:Sulfatase n=1 Tax=Microbacterium hominis TaxID=162426 RepID=A0A7D4TS95_9MICO|nr:sulfatase [Microbacterium hominis]QKJ20624.1 sulfatase [Microbacterium hominis]
MRAVILMFDSLNRHMLSPYADSFIQTPNFDRLAARTVVFDNFYAGSMPCMPARREMHTGRYNFLHRSWGPLEPFDDSMPEMLRDAGIHTHLVSDHPHYWEDGGATYHTRYSTWEFLRGQEGDPWKGVVDPAGAASNPLVAMRRQDAINRRYMPTEAEHSQTLTVDAGLEFIDTNSAADKWLVQIELFDPHEPFFTHQKYKDQYPHEYDGPEFDWPGYQKVYEPEDQVEHARMEYAALVSMCDASLGRVLDAFDRHGLWEDTLLIVNTDHGFLLGEHGWWAKSVQPWYNELVHLPMFVWDPRTKARGDRRSALTQTIDIAPTVLRYFELEPTEDMLGHDLGEILVAESEPREAALFGIHGGHVNVTDGRYVYMRAAAARENTPLEEFTLMPTHMRSRFGVHELTAWEPAEPMSFTKGVRTMRMPTTGMWMSPWQHGTLLFDLEKDPRQELPMVDDTVELRMLELLRAQLIANDAPDSQFERLGFPRVGELTSAHLLVRAQRDLATATAAPLPAPDDLQCRDILELPIIEALAITPVRDVLSRLAPQLGNSEGLGAGMGLSLIGLARFGMIPADQLRFLDAELAVAVAVHR